MELEKIREELHKLERELLLALQKCGGEATPQELVGETGIEEVSILKGASWTATKNLVDVQERIERVVTLAHEGREYLERGFPERRALQALADLKGKTSLKKLMKESGLNENETDIALGWLSKRGWAEIKEEGGETVLEITDAGKSMVEKEMSEEKLLQLLAEKGSMKESGIAEIITDTPDIISGLAKRKNVISIDEKISRQIKLTDKGWKLLETGVEVTEEITQLTPEIVRSGVWRVKGLRKYDVTMPAPKIYPGKTHPLREIIDEMRKIFLEMGFREIRGPLIESAFWNFDALFQPQDHPAREMQDTFYLKQPNQAQLPPKKIVEDVARTHEDGGITRSEGWGYSWNINEAKRTVLRTHTTATTIRYLAQHQEPPIKVFSIDRTFRRETIDFQHLAEFHQVEGIVMDEKATLRDLMGILQEFFYKLGFKKIRMRPGYFPYTEPSLEVDVYFPEQKKWIETTGAGIFRPEVTEPLGIKYPVLAWGASLERPAMVQLDLTDIRTFYRNDLDWVRRSL